MKFAGKYQKERVNYFLKSGNHDYYLQKIRKNTLWVFDEKQCHLKEIESIPWNKKISIF